VSYVDQEYVLRKKIAAEVRALGSAYVFSIDRMSLERVAQVVEDGPIDVTKPVTVYTTVRDPRIKAARQAMQPYITGVSMTTLGNMARCALIAAQEASDGVR
jgi:hypothetical protein